MANAPTRERNGVVIPGVGEWQIDPGHTDLAFTGRHFMITKVRGRFTEVAGTITITEDFTDSVVEATVVMASVESGNPTRDEHLRSTELFDVAEFPEATFTGRVSAWDATAGVVTGELTLHGITRAVAFEVSFEGHVRDPWGGDRAVFSAHTRVNRQDFGISWNVPLESGGLLVSNEISIDIELEAVRS
jgi:polyisoprenoid-binding protein YceI